MPAPDTVHSREGRDRFLQLVMGSSELTVLAGFCSQKASEGGTGTEINCPFYLYLKELELRYGLLAQPRGTERTTGQQ